MDSTGDVFIADTDNSRILELPKTGTGYAAAKNCTVNVTFAPLVTGARTGSVEIVDGGNVLATTTISGYGSTISAGPAVAEVSTSLLQFGTIAYGSVSSTLPLTVTNIGGGTLTISPSLNGQSFTIVENGWQRDWRRATAAHLRCSSPP